MNLMLINVLVAPYFMPTAPNAPTLPKESADAPAESTYHDLDRAIESLRLASQEPSPTQFGALVRTYIDSAPDDLSATGENVVGARLYDAQVWFDAMIGPFELFVKMDAGETTGFPPIDGTGVTDFTLRDAYARTNLTDQFQLYWGQFKCPVVATANVGDGRLAMVDRTRIGQLFSAPGAYQPGAAVTADFGNFHAKLAVQNGADGQGEDYGAVARVEYKIGEGAKQSEGAVGYEGTNATFGLGYFKDNSDIAGEDFGSVVVADVYANFNRLSVQAEIMDADEEFASRALGNTTDDATPYDATVGYLFGEEQTFEAFLRYQDLDNEVNADQVGVGVNYYVLGHAAKWQLNVSNYDDDNADGTIIQFGLSLGESDPSFRGARPN